MGLALSLGASALVPVAAPPAGAATPRYNGLIVFDSTVDSKTAIYTVNPDGSALTRLTADGAAMPSWSPDGSQLVFTTWWNGDAELYVMNADGSNQHRLVERPTANDWSPAWSPDGSKIAFVTSDLVNGAISDIVVVNSDGSGAVNLTNSRTQDTDPAWSPDGSRIAFATDRDGDFEIYTMDLSGGDVRNLTQAHSSSEVNPDWSPDGSTMAFASDRVGRYQFDVYLMPAAGGATTQVTTTSQDGDPSWSPEGNRLATASRRDFDNEIYTMAPDGWRPVRVTRNNPLGGTDRRPDWQPRSTPLPSDPAGEYTPLTPSRILDTRDGTGGHLGAVGQGGAIDVAVAGHGGVPSTGAGAVVMNVTVTEPTADSYLTLWPSGTERPLASNLNYLAGQTVPNLVTVALGPNGAVTAFNLTGRVHVIFDVVGFFSGPGGPNGSRFQGVDPYRLFDTRDWADPVGQGETLDIELTWPEGTPPGSVTGIVLNVTVTESTAPSFLTVYPGDVGRPLASNLNFVPGVTVPNLVIVRLPANNVIRFYNNTGATHVVADVVGVFDLDRSTNAGRFVGLRPARLADTRDYHRPLGPDSVAYLQVAGRGGVPAGAEAAVLNVTVTEPTAPSFLTVFPDDSCEIPLASNLNFTAGQTVPNLVMVRLGEAGPCTSSVGAVDFYNLAGDVHLVADVFGYFSGP